MTSRSAFGLAVLGLAGLPMLAAPAMADVAVGVGISVAFGGNGTQTGLGVRLFSDDEEDSFVGSIGLDYQFQAQTWRPTIGVAYLGENLYAGLDLGYAFNGGGFDYGMSLGAVDTDKDDPPAAIQEPNDGNGEGELQALSPGV